MFINLTPHDINIVDNIVTGKVVRTIPVSGIVARVCQQETTAGDIDGIPLVILRAGTVQDLPKPKAGVYYIVSRAVQEACPNRHDLLVPTWMVRSADRRTIIGCAAFTVNQEV